MARDPRFTSGFICLILALSLSLVALAGCGSASPTATPNPTAVPTPPPTPTTAPTPTEVAALAPTIEAVETALATAEEGLPTMDFDQYLTPKADLTPIVVGADSPEGALRGFIAGLEAKDVNAALGYVDPDQQATAASALDFLMLADSLRFENLNVTVKSSTDTSATLHMTGSLVIVSQGTSEPVPLDDDVPSVKRNGKWFIQGSGFALEE